MLRNDAIRDDPDYWHLTFLESILRTLKPGTSVEIGVATGAGTSILSRYSKSVYAVDLNPDAYKFIKNLHNVDFMNSTSWEALEFLQKNHSEKIDFIFIDGDHRQEIAFGDFVRAKELVSPGGIIALHDTYPRSREFISQDNEWCGSAYKLPGMIHDKFPEYNCLTIPIHPGLTLAQRRIDQPLWMNQESQN